MDTFGGSRIHNILNDTYFNKRLNYLVELAENKKIISE